MGACQQKECCAPATDVNDVVGSEAALMLIDELIAEHALQPLTDAEIGIVENTWKQVAGLGVETVGVILFKHIFTIAPDALGLFAFRKESKWLPQWVRQSMGFETSRRWCLCCRSWPSSTSVTECFLSIMRSWAKLSC
mmetsp:Transcript_108190/g.345529  ORF Transcript_108190/g.345529 Transcript_108190/m.345529 type:complete len:138 (-) Transcript_108190:776-1189(-)